jgi:outer membrane protein assembly factor BamB
MTRPFRAIILAAPLVMLTACMSWFEPEQPPPLPGERRPALMVGSDQTLIPEVKPIDFRAPEPWVNNEWPQAGGFAGHAMQHLALNAGPLARVWSVDIGDGAQRGSPLTAQPVVLSGRVYAMDREAQVTSIELKTGRVLWRLYVGAKNEDDVTTGGGLAASNGRLYITNGFAEALSLSEDGKEVWRARLPAPARAAPTVLDERVYVTTLDGQLLALDATTGEQLWSYRGISDGTSIVGAPAPAANSEIVVAPFSSGELAALRVENGSVAWMDNLAPAVRLGGLLGISDIRALPVIDQGVVYAISFGGRLVALDERTGAPLWQRDVGGQDTPWIAGDRLYVLTKDAQLLSITAKDGSLAWRLDLPRFDDVNSKKNPVMWLGPIMAGGRLLLVRTGGEMIGVDPATGQVKQQFQIGFMPAVPMVVAAQTLLVLESDGTLSAWR